MPNAYIILGDANARKTSSIRALTGIGREGIVQIEDKNGAVFDIYAKLSSLQESRITPQDFISKMFSTGQSNFLFPLWVKGKRNQSFPDGVVYIQHLINVWWNVNNTVILNTKHQINIPNSVVIRNSTKIPSNKIASIIRGSWNWH